MPRSFAGHLVVGHLVGQGALVLASPVLTRLYDPAEVGRYQLVMTIAIILAPIASWRYEYVLPVVDSSAMVAHYYRAARRTITIAAAASLLVVGGITFSLGLPDAVAYTVGIGLCVALYAWTAVDNASLIRRGLQHRLAARNALQGVVGAVLQISGGLVHPSFVMIVGGVVAGRVVAIVMTSRAAGARDDLARQRPDSLPAYRPPPVVPLVAAGALGNVSSQVLILLAFSLYGAAEAGQLSLAQRLSGLPVMLIGQALVQVFVSAASPSIRQGEPVWPALRGMVMAVLGASAAVATIGVLVGPIATEILLGADWHVAGQLVRLLAIPTALQLLAIPAGALFGLLGRSGAAVLVQAVRVLMVGATFVAASVLPFTQAIAISAGGWVASYVVMATVLIVMVRANDDRAQSTARRVHHAV